MQRPTVAGRFAEVRGAGRCALVPFIVAGDPDLGTTARALEALDAAGADVIELGVPYSDPLADGPTIQAAAARALLKDTGLSDVIDMVGETSPKVSAPIVMFTYYNPIMAMGLETFLARIKAAGASGLLVPDLPLEETGGIRAACGAAGIELVLLATPTTPTDRMKEIAEASSGFVYLVSVAGVTGARTEVADRVEGLVSKLKGVTDKPVAVGFGVSEASQAERLRNWGADGVIVGSALVKALGEAESPEAGLAALTEKMESLSGVLR